LAKTLDVAAKMVAGTDLHRIAATKSVQVKATLGKLIARTRNLRLICGSLLHSFGREVRPIWIGQINYFSFPEHSVEPLKAAFTLKGVRNLVTDVDCKENGTSIH
jgi:hypothetical protein